MSDFDKEAEREKLREKFERDRAKRQESERMSELLLKGATMTNKHHDCGSPIFRWQGEEFCPSCESPVGAGEAETPGRQAEAATEGESGMPEGAEDTTDTAVDATTDGEPATGEPTSGADPTEIDVTPEPPAGENGVGGEPTTTGSTEPTGAERQTPPEPTRPSTRATSGSTGDRATAGDEPATGEGVAVAWASLERTLVEVARQAEATPDLSRKRDLLAAAREAAEALEATRRASR